MPKKQPEKTGPSNVYLYQDGKKVPANTPLLHHDKRHFIQGTNEQNELVEVEVYPQSTIFDQKLMFEDGTPVPSGLKPYRIGRKQYVEITNNNKTTSVEVFTTCTLQTHVAKRESRTSSKTSKVWSDQHALVFLDGTFVPEKTEVIMKGKKRFAKIIGENQQEQEVQVITKGALLKRQYRKLRKKSLLDEDYSTSNDQYSDNNQTLEEQNVSQSIETNDFSSTVTDQIDNDSFVAEYNTAGNVVQEVEKRRIHLEDLDFSEAAIKLNGTFKRKFLDLNPLNDVEENTIKQLKSSNISITSTSLFKPSIDGSDENIQAFIDAFKSHAENAYKLSSAKAIGEHFSKTILHLARLHRFDTNNCFKKPLVKLINSLYQDAMTFNPSDENIRIERDSWLKQSGENHPLTEHSLENEENDAYFSYFENVIDSYLAQIKTFFTKKSHIETLYTKFLSIENDSASNVNRM